MQISVQRSFINGVIGRWRDNWRLKDRSYTSKVSSVYQRRSDLCHNEGPNIGAPHRVYHRVRYGHSQLHGKITWTVRYTRGTNPLLSSSQRARSKLNAVKQFVGNDPELRVIVRLLGGDLGRSQKCFAIPLVAVSTHP